MTNVLNSILANQPINKSVNQNANSAFVFTSEGKIKPMRDKGRLLPSRVFGSPIEYAKDLKKDIVSIGKAAKGKANDHELGRINDLAMKMGSLALASYLFVKNPLKLSKAMEFVGFGTFFASMSLWPKLAIQAPLKARTGVDIHQKYIDSQGRKKMLFQDPQYVLTDLYSREDLDKIGDKLGVNKNIPDRDNFIKQRAQKTALQGNTLWMMTAGFASPLMSALLCNRLEKPIGKAIEKFEMVSSERAMQNGNYRSLSDRFKEFVSLRRFDNYLVKNADKVMDDKAVSELASKLGGKANSALVQTAIKDELAALKTDVKIDELFIRNALKGKIDDSVFASLSEQQKSLLNKAINNKSFANIAEILSRAAGGSKKEQIKLSRELSQILGKAKMSAETPTLSQISNQIKALHANMLDFASGKRILDRYINARVGDQAGTYIANQWGRVGDKLIKALKFNGQELKAVSKGDIDIIIDKLTVLASNDAEYDKVIKQLMKLIGNYENTTDTNFVLNVQNKAKSVCTVASNDLKTNGFVKLAEKISSATKNGTVENVININTAERISGAQSSFYRLLQSLDVFRKANNGSLERQLASLLGEKGVTADQETLKRLVKACQDLVLNATTTDYVEKLKTAGFNLSEIEYKTVMKALFDSEADTTIAESLSRTIGADKVDDVMKGFNSYRKEFMNKVANWQNGMTTELSRRTVDGVTNAANAVERNNLAGKPIRTLIEDVAKQTYNSQKWLKIFGGAMVALTAVTLLAGLAIGRKGKTEKQVEKESKVNG